MALSLLDLTIVAVPFLAVILFALRVKVYMRSVADFLVASRTAGRYLICTASAEVSALFGVAGWEVISRSGFCLGLWSMFGAMVTLFMILVGFVGYRFRETRVMTFHQFFEVRYSRNLRIGAGFLNFAAGIVGFGIMPGVMARFVVYFAGLPVTLNLAGIQVPTFALLMIAFLSFAIFYTTSGGQVTVMLTDALEGIFSGALYMVVGISILTLVSWRQVAVALTSGEPGKSYINPFDTTQHADFNIWYALIGIVISIYNFRGISAFSSAAKTAHEAKMAGVLGWWRGFVGTGFGSLVAVAAFTHLHHPDFASTANQVEGILSTIDNPAVQSQMRMPLAIRLMLPDGIRGAFFTIGLFGVIANFGSTLHGLGGMFVQDVVLPFRKAQLDPKQHIRWLRFGIVFVALFGLTFSLLYTPSDALILFGTLASTIYMGGAGAVVIGGLYWKRGTTAGAWTSMILGSTLAGTGRLVIENWGRLQPWLIEHTSPGALHDYIATHSEKCPMNAQWMTLAILILCSVCYILVSLKTCKVPFDMERMLHRGKYSLEPIAEPNAARLARKKFSFGALIGIDEHYTRGDKVIAVGIFVWEFGSNLLGLIIIIWNLCFWKWTDTWWLAWSGIRGFVLIPAIGFVVVIWLSIGAIRDMRRLMASLKTVVRNDSDDGTVRGHHNVGEPEKAAEPEPAKK